MPDVIALLAEVESVAPGQVRVRDIEALCFKIATPAATPVPDETIESVPEVVVHVQTSVVDAATKKKTFI